jgi:hypothetical protein
MTQISQMGRPRYRSRILSQNSLWSRWALWPKFFELDLATEGTEITEVLSICVPVRNLRINPEFVLTNTGRIHPQMTQISQIGRRALAAACCRPRLQTLRHNHL